MKRTFSPDTKLNGKWATWFLELNKNYDHDGRIFITFQLYQQELVVHKVYSLNENNCEKVYDFFYNFIKTHKEEVTIEEIRLFLIDIENKECL